MLLNFAAKEIVRIVGTKGRAFHLQGEEFVVFLREQDPKKIIQWVEGLTEEFQRANIWINGKRKRMPFNLKVGIYKKEGKFYLQYQPILDLKSEEVIGA